MISVRKKIVMLLAFSSFFGIQPTFGLSRFDALKTKICAMKNSCTSSGKNLYLRCLNLFKRSPKVEKPEYVRILHPDQKEVIMILNGKAQSIGLTDRRQQGLFLEIDLEQDSIKSVLENFRSYKEQRSTVPNSPYKFYIDKLDINETDQLEHCFIYCNENECNPNVPHRLMHLAQNDRNAVAIDDYDKLKSVIEEVKSFTQKTGFARFLPWTKSLAFEIVVSQEHYKQLVHDGVLLNERT